MAADGTPEDLDQVLELYHEALAAFMRGTTSLRSGCSPNGRT
jgi:hypothetical protein